MNDSPFRAGNHPGPTTGDLRPLAGDMLRGADAIAEFLLGDPKKRRQVYHLAEKGNLPVFRLGQTLCARRSTLLAWIAEQEAHAASAGPKAAE